ncbi:MAG: endonuclease/exonuclease/phosphatase family protein [Bacteroidetes bacterium]|nr:endonuclease/exonuclease/phosphatase family protein [Bacteroidota bacterium]
MKILRKVMYALLVPIGAFLLFLLYAEVDDYKPDKKINKFTATQTNVLSDSSVLNLLIWNIGYAGLDASMDFFYDGGEQTRQSREGVNSNLEGIRSTLSPYNGYDFILLQEVDIDSKRSYHVNQAGVISEDFQGYQTYTGTNYKVFFVPIPVSNPMGKVESVVMTMSRHTPTSADRYSFPGNYSWPMSLFMLDRCFLVQRHPVSDGNELLIINTHNSSYDDGSLRKQQMIYLKDFLLDEYKRGNYVIVGGDWNQSPNGFAPELPAHQFDTINLTYVEKDFPEPGWNWAYDPALPTNRRVSVPYNRSTSLATVIDYFLLSPNIRIEEVKTLDEEFRFSDHQPVQLVARMNPK